jgi:hypothetical protein
VAMWPWAGGRCASGQIWRRLPSWQERQPPSPPSSTAASPNTQVTRKTAQANTGAGEAAAAKTRAAQAAAVGDMSPSEETCAAASKTQVPSPNTLQRSARPSRRPRHIPARWTPQQKTAREAGRGRHTPRQQLFSRLTGQSADQGAASDPGRKRLLDLT